MLVGDETGFLLVRSDGGRFEVEDWQPLNLFRQLEPSTLPAVCPEAISLSHSPSPSNTNLPSKLTSRAKLLAPGLDLRYLQNILCKLKNNDAFHF